MNISTSIRLLCAVCCLVNYINAEGYLPMRYYHDYVKDGRPVDGPFPALKNAPYYCYQAPSKGPCAGTYMVWFYDIVRRKCMPMFYSGCGGNENRFQSEGICKAFCEKNKPLR